MNIIAIQIFQCLNHLRIRKEHSTDDVIFTSNILDRHGKRIQL